MKKFWKQEIVTVNKRRTEMPSRRKSILYLWKKNPKEIFLMIKIIEELETIVILQVNIEIQHIVFVI